LFAHLASYTYFIVRNSCWQTEYLCLYFNAQSIRGEKYTWGGYLDMWVHTKVGEAIKTEQQESENEGNAEPGLNPKPHV